LSVNISLLIDVADILPAERSVQFVLTSLPYRYYKHCLNISHPDYRCSKCGHNSLHIRLRKKKKNQISVVTKFCEFSK